MKHTQHNYNDNRNTAAQSSSWGVCFGWPPYYPWTLGHVLCGVRLGEVLLYNASCIILTYHSWLYLPET